VDDHAWRCALGTRMGDNMTVWTPPAPGPWQQDTAHTPNSQSLIMRETYPAGFNRGFTETFARYGILLDRLAMAEVNGFTYHQPQPFDMPGPDGPMSPEEIGAEFGRRVALAEETFREKRWRADIEEWDRSYKPAAIELHLAFDAVELETLTDDELAEHLRAVAAHVTAMVYQHHRFNMAAILPVGDMALHVAGWAGVPPPAALALVDGYSPISKVASSEMTAAMEAIRSGGLEDLLVGGDGADERLAELCRRAPDVDRYVRLIRNRVIDGFDVTNPTLREHPGLVLGKLAAGLAADPDAARMRSDELATRLRAQTPAEHRDEFDELVREARLVYRLRDERGIYSEITAIGLMRRALLEIGRRAAERGHLDDIELTTEATVDEAVDVMRGDGPSAVELAARRAERQRLTKDGAPRFLGDPPPPHPPLDALPPVMARMMGGVGFMIDSILGQLDAAIGEGSVIGGIGVNDVVVEGTARLIRDIADLVDVDAGDVLVAATTTEAVNSVLHLVAAIVTDHGSHACHAAIVAREMGFPAVVGTVNATQRIANGDRVRVDGGRGEITVLT
jgi:rifampicin phosphotransferase